MRRSCCGSSSASRRAFSARARYPLVPVLLSLLLIVFFDDCARTACGGSYKLTFRARGRGREATKDPSSSDGEKEGGDDLLLRTQRLREVRRDETTELVEDIGRAVLDRLSATGGGTSCEEEGGGDGENECPAGRRPSLGDARCDYFFPLHLDDPAKIMRSDGISCSLAGYYHSVGSEPEGKGGVVQLTYLSDGTGGDEHVDVLIHSLDGEGAADEEEALVHLATEVLPTRLKLALSSSDDSDSDSSTATTTTWTIVPHGASSTETNGEAADEASLSKLVLSNPDLGDKVRLYHSPPSPPSESSSSASAASPPVSVWSYLESATRKKAVFVGNTLRAHLPGTTSDVAHAEALVHPALISHVNPRRVLIVSDVPHHVVAEVVKYASVETVDVVGVTGEVVRGLLLSLAADSEEYNAWVDDERVSIVDMSSGHGRRDVKSWVDRRVDALPPQPTVPIYEEHDSDAVYADPESEEEDAWLANLCYNETVAVENDRNGYDWERQVYCGPDNDLWADYEGSDDGEEEIPDEEEIGGEKGTSAAEADAAATAPSLYDAILVDVPPYLQEEWLSVPFQKRLHKLLDKTEGVLVISAGAPPSDLLPVVSTDDEDEDEDEDEEGMDARGNLLRYLGRHPTHGGVGYELVTVYDEPLARPLASAYILAMPSSYGETNGRFYRNSPAKFDLDMVDRLVPSTGPGTPPTALYDGTTHQRYRHPSRAWEVWYCSTAPWKYLNDCAFATRDLFDPSHHHTGTEMRRHPMKGRSLHTTEFVAKGHFVNSNDVAQSISIDETQWEALVEFVDKYSDATMYRDLRDFWVAYGYETRVLGATGWTVSLASTSTFSNHACTDKETNTGPCGDLFHDEDGLWGSFSPPILRRPITFGGTTCARRDIQPEEEIAINYGLFRDDLDSHPYQKMFLRNMCTQGRGVVRVDDQEAQSNEE